MGRTTSGARFWVTYPANDVSTAALIAALTDAGSSVSVDAQQAKATVRLLATALLPLMILANLFALFFTAGSDGGSGIGEVVDFSKLTKEATGAGTVSFADVAGVEEAIEELDEVVDYLTNPDRYAGLGAVPPKGVLLLGPPGCGKTLLAKAVAGEARVPFFSVAGAEFVESLVGVGAARVRDLFARVRAAAPAIVFIDEVDAAGRRRGSGGTGGGLRSATRPSTSCWWRWTASRRRLASWSWPPPTGPTSWTPPCCVPAASTATSPSSVPTASGARPSFACTPRTGLCQAVSTSPPSPARPPGFTGADLANVVNEAALLTIRAGKPEIDGATLSEAVQRVLSGPQRRGHLLSDTERLRVAVHEAGHAVVAGALGRAGDVHRVSIVARGRGLGGTGLHREEDAVVFTERQLRERLVTILGGRAAEELLFDEASTGSEDDIADATALALDMAGRYGMSPALGLPALLTGAGDYLGNTAGPALLSGTTHAALDAEVRRLLDDARTAARALLETHRDALDRLAERLLAEESLEGSALLALLPHPPAADNGHDNVLDLRSAATSGQS